MRGIVDLFALIKTWANLWLDKVDYLEWGPTVGRLYKKSTHVNKYFMTCAGLAARSLKENKQWKMFQ